MNYYWVNIGSTHKEVKENNFLWAPKDTKNKHGTVISNAGWVNVPLVKQDDIIICHKNGYIIYVAVAKGNAAPANRPKNRVYEAWKESGFKVEVTLNELKVPVSTDIFKDTFYVLHNDNCVPPIYTLKREAAQKYMCLLTKAAAALVLSSIGENIDLLEIESKNKPIKKTEKERIAKARIGQGQFRLDVLKMWENTCPLSKVDDPSLLTASHIHKWALANNEERLDKHNGLPLSPNLDKLFDKGYISFNNQGELLLNKKINIAVLEKLGIKIGIKINNLTKRNKHYLQKHRELYDFD